MKHQRSGLRRKEVFAVFAAAVLLLAGALLAFTFRNRGRIISQNREYLTDNAVQAADSIDDAVGDGYDNIRILSELVNRSLTGPDFDIASIQKLISNSVFDFMEYADREGMDHNITGGVSDAHDREYYLNAKAGNTGMELIYESRATHETLLMFYSPITWQGEFAGSLVGVYQASNRITRLLSSEYFGEQAVAYLAAGDGRIIASNQGFDPRNEMHITDLAGEDAALKEKLSAALRTGESLSFSLKDNPTGGCLVHLPESGMHLVQIFPVTAGNRMLRAANAAGYALVLFMLLLFGVFLLAVIRFYRGQQRVVEEAREQADKASAAKTKFLFNMSHDIRTPMNAILGFTEIGLRHSGDEEKARDSFRKVRVAGGHLLNLINDILEMSRIESGRLEIAENPLDLRDIVKGVDEMSCALAAPKSIDYRTELIPMADPFVMFDELHLNEVIINLVSNAVKYTGEGGAVSFRAEQLSAPENGRARYRFTVRDNGIGMSETFQEHLFEAFAREESAEVSRVEGAGLGLSIVKRIVGLAGGTVKAESRRNEGSVFTVELPLRVMIGSAIEAYRKEKQAEMTGYAARADMRGKRILLVEDNEMNREIATELLTEAGFGVETACNGAEAVRTVTEKGVDYYDAVLMDIRIPVMDGYEATREIRKIFGADMLPIIALSANAFREDVEQSLAAGMDDHLAKPIDVKELFVRLERFIR